MANSFEIDQDKPEIESIATLAENLVFRLPGCTDQMIRKTLQEVYRDFCRRSFCLNYERHIKMLPNECNYPVGSIVGGFIDGVVVVKMGGKILIEGRDYKIIGNVNPIISIRKSLAIPEGYDGEVFLNCLCIEVPGFGEEKAPFGFIAKYGEYICSGVLAKLMIMNGRPWYDPNQAMKEFSVYENAVGNARIAYYVGSDSGSYDCGRGVDTSELI